MLEDYLQLNGEIGSRSMPGRGVKDPWETEQARRGCLYRDISSSCMVIPWCEFLGAGIKDE